LWTNKVVVEVLVAGHVVRVVRALRLQLSLGACASGLGGVGKTEIAIQYVHRDSYDYDLVWWVLFAQVNPDLLILGAAWSPLSQPQTYPPWRGNPRPIEAQLQGFYAFLAVGYFWRSQRCRLVPVRLQAVTVDAATSR
jgi:hypothetical protein